MRRYIILDPNPLDRFRKAVGALGLHLERPFPPTPDMPCQEAWTDTGGQVVAQMVEDVVLGVTYLAVYGEPNAIVRTVAFLVQNLELLNPETTVTLARDAQTPEEKVVSANRMAIAREEFDAETFALLSQWSEDADFTVRAAAVRALGYLRWAEARPLLEDRARNDPDEWLRDFAARCLTQLDG